MFICGVLASVVFPLSLSFSPCLLDAHKSFFGTFECCFPLRCVALPLRWIYVLARLLCRGRNSLACVARLFMSTSSRTDVDGAALAGAVHTELGCVGGDLGCFARLSHVRIAMFVTTFARVSFFLWLGCSAEYGGRSYLVQCTLSASVIVCWWRVSRIGRSLLTARFPHRS